MSRGANRVHADALEFAPAILRAQERAPSPLPRVVLRALLLLLGVALAWTVLGRLDVVAIAPGKLVPRSFIKIVQPAEGGIVREIRVTEGEAVSEGQVLARMDARLTEADRSVVENEVRLRELQLRRIDAELSGRAMAQVADDSAALFAQVDAQHRARRQAHQDTIETEQALLTKARQDLKAAQEAEGKLQKTVPIYREQAEGWNKLAREGFAGKLMAMDRQRQYIESTQDLKAQAHSIGSLNATIEQSQRRIAQLASGYRQQLQTERVEISLQVHRLQQELAKQQHRAVLQELRAPQSGVVKDIATYTPGTVVAPGTVLMTVVPQDEPLQAEIWVSNQDAGFVRQRQTVRLKLAAYPFQRYGTMQGILRHVSADATERGEAGAARAAPGTPMLAYRALVDIESVTMVRDGVAHPLVPGMQVTAEVHLGTRRIIEYLLSPVSKIAQEAVRER